METTETLVKTMESILKEREASQAKEKEAVESLTAADGISDRAAPPGLPATSKARSGS